MWSRVSSSHPSFPPRLQRCFHRVRQCLEQLGRPAEESDRLVSSCVFLRYLCPAVLSPSLFGLADALPGERAARNLTLVAKALMTLANFARYEGRDNYMAFLNGFLEEEREPMRNFLRRVSGPVPEEQWILLNAATGDPCAMDPSELGRHLSCLHTILNENASKLECKEEDSNPVASRLRDILDEINQLLRTPKIRHLEQISQPTITTLRQVQDSEASSSTQQSSSSKFSWWTLPKKRPNSTSSSSGGGDRSSAGGGTLSHPAPHHSAEKPSQLLLPSFAKPETGAIASSLESGSASSSAGDASPTSASNPSPSGPRLASARASIPAATTLSSSSSAAVHGTLPRWPHRAASASTIAINQNSSPPKNQNQSSNTNKFASSYSLDESGADSSDDSTYSSQCHSDANSTPRCASASQTLPRPLTGGGHGYSTHSRHRSVQRGCHVSSLSPGHHCHPTQHHRLSHSHLATTADQSSSNKTLGDYEREILELRSAMETLQIKLGEAERKLEERGGGKRRRESGGDEEEEEEEEDDKEERVKEAVNRLAAEEERLRREQV